MRRELQCARLWQLCLLGWGLSACSPPTHEQRSSHGTGPSSLGAGRPPGPLIKTELPREEVSAAPSSPSAEALPEGSLAPEMVEDADGPFQAAAPVELGPAGPLAAVADGALLITRDHRLLRLRREGEGFQKAGEGPQAFSKFAKGPALTEHYAYWVSREGELFRASLQTGKAQWLGVAARSGSRVSAVHARHELVAFLAESGERLVARLWVEHPGAKSEVLELTELGNSASSLALLPDPVAPTVISLEGRTGMSPLHSRKIFDKAQSTELGPDSVLWVGPGTGPLTELKARWLPNRHELVLLAAASDITHFGLAQLLFDQQAHSVQAPRWAAYENGLDPAPVAAEQLCGQLWVAYVAPMTASPRSPQELRIAAYNSQGLGPSQVLARALAFNELSVSAASNTELILAYTADRSSWGQVLRCRSHH